MICARLPRCRPIRANEVTLLPEPDSPTIPRAPPAGTSKERPFTAWTSPSIIGNVTRRSSTRTTGDRFMEDASL
ncbi:putative aBC transporter intracellular ATPase subunit [Nocardiopsis alba ATCC BAA-2165]|uniref:Putative aBC transporter intracellular ATPase subunit n=1 Tax=Nocardiopsis alba (strain ATCC BAA-2165 / BE74) TaxID=1205910 RepID=J7LH41_NOCAA|nr:putative aBC transporter intracellular ATPase subunit [Nocardiopsis alba ATCC BAA-2165]